MWLVSEWGENEKVNKPYCLSSYSLENRLSRRSRCLSKTPEQLWTVCQQSKQKQNYRILDIRTELHNGAIHVAAYGIPNHHYCDPNPKHSACEWVCGSIEQLNKMYEWFRVYIRLCTELEQFKWPHIGIAHTTQRSYSSLAKCILPYCCDDHDDATDD